MSADTSKRALNTTDVSIRTAPSVYPAPYDKVVEGRVKRQLGDAFGLKNFGVNLTEIAPNTQTSLLHRHTLQDEFVYVLDGYPTLVTEEGEQELSPGMCVGFPAAGIAHCLINKSDGPVRILEVGDRTPGDLPVYPEADLAAEYVDGVRRFVHKDGTSYND